MPSIGSPISLVSSVGNLTLVERKSAMAIITNSLIRKNLFVEDVASSRRKRIVLNTAMNTLNTNAVSAAMYRFGFALELLTSVMIAIRKLELLPQFLKPNYPSVIARSNILPMEKNFYWDVLCAGSLNSIASISYLR
jgi:hypothetical protein